VTTNTSANRGEVYRICSWNTRERSQRFALVVAGCDPCEIASDCLRHLEPRFFDLGYDSTVGVCSVSSVESIVYAKSWFSSFQQVDEAPRLGRLAGRRRNSLLVRSSSLVCLSPRRENLNSRQHEKSVAESVYLLQRPAYECNLSSLSGNQLIAESHPPCPVS
jgi:hypothetical protein